jgi:phosphatidylglycerophosphatase A
MAPEPHSSSGPESFNAITAPSDHDQQRAVRPSEPRSEVGRVGPISVDAKPGSKSGSRWGPAVWIATVAGVGFFPVAPGTAGSLAGVLVFLASQGLGLAVHLALGVGVFALGVQAASASEIAFGSADDGRIVIDEVVGQWIALTPLFVFPVAGAAFFFAVVTAFVAFRVFDVWKPGPVRWAERRFRGGMGVMADDVVAGVLAAVPVSVLLAALLWLAGNRLGELA